MHTYIYTDIRKYIHTYIRKYIHTYINRPILRFLLHFTFLYMRPDNGPKVSECVAYTKIYNYVKRHMTEFFQQDGANVRDFLNLFVIYHVLFFPVYLKIIPS